MIPRGRPAAPLPELLVGAWGWDHECWFGSFYPPDLPPAWRLSYYANEFRAVLVPGPLLAAADGQILAAWAADVPPGFRFYVEIDRAVLAGADVGRLWQRLAPLVPGLGGALLSAPVPPGVRDILAARAPVSVAPETVGSAGGCGSCWDPGGAAEPGGCFGRVRREPAGSRELRLWVERFMSWGRGCEQAMLCFDALPGAPRWMQEARVIAELLGG